MPFQNCKPRLLLGTITIQNSNLSGNSVTIPISIYQKSNFSLQYQAKDFRQSFCKGNEFVLDLLPTMLENKMED